MSRADAKRALQALEEVVLGQLGNAERVRIGGFVQLTVRVKPATKKRKGRNPATGEEITIAAKPASVDVRARPLAKAKAALPSVQEGTPPACRSQLTHRPTGRAVISLAPRCATQLARRVRAGRSVARSVERDRSGRGPRA
jgi:DNA-binding protein HU-beta